MALDLLKRSELARGLTNAEEDANKTAIEAFINGLLAGTAGYEAGDSLKLGGVLANSFWNNANCTKSLGSSGWRKLADGSLEGWAAVSVTSGVAFNFNTACGVTFSVCDSIVALPIGAAYKMGINSASPTGIIIATDAPASTQFFVRVLGRP